MTADNRHSAAFDKWAFSPQSFTYLSHMASYVCHINIYFSPLGEFPPGGSASPGARSPAGSTGYWIGIGYIPGPSRPSGRCVSPPTGPGRRCWWCPQYLSPGCCLAPTSHRHPEAPSGGHNRGNREKQGNGKQSATLKSQSPTCAQCCICLRVPFFSTWMSKVNLLPWNKDRIFEDSELP